jgi:hypothetical protein
MLVTRRGVATGVTTAVEVTSAPRFWPVQEELRRSTHGPLNGGRIARKVAASQLAWWWSKLWKEYYVNRCRWQLRSFEQQA